MKAEIDLTGSQCLITGGARGIGKAIALAAAGAGCEVIVHYAHNQTAARATVGEITQAGGLARSVRADLLSRDEREELVRAAFAEEAHVRHLVLNAGIWERSPIEALDEDLLHRHLELHVTATLTLIRDTLPMLSEGSSIVMIGSTAGQRGEAFFVPYAATKAALFGILRSLAVELGPRGIRINVVAPGWVDTDMTSDVLRGEYRDQVVAGIPLRRIAQPQDIAGPVLFLLSELSRHMTGSTLSVNGGAVFA